MKTDQISLITFYSVKDQSRGTLCVAEYGQHIPFEIKRIFYLYDMPKGCVRGEHAHRKQDQLVICLTGRLELTAQRNNEVLKFTLSKPNEGVYLPPMTWISIKVLEEPTLCLVISSGAYDENDYIRNYGDFRTLHNSA